MSTSYYTFQGHEHIGVTTWEKRPCFTWAANPITFIQWALVNTDVMVEDEYGHLQPMWMFLAYLESMAVHRYEKEAEPQ